MSDLVEQIDALLALNAKGSVSHPVPGLAVELLERAKTKLLERRSSSIDVERVKVTDADVQLGNDWLRGSVGSADPSRLKTAADAILSALSTPPLAVQDGPWVLVPREPTDEMASAVIALDPKLDFDARYRAAVAAAPAPETFGFVPLSVYESAVKGRQDFRQSYRAARGFSQQQVRDMLRELYEASGLSFDKYGATVNLSGEFIRSVLNGGRPPSKAICDLVGVEECVVYKTTKDSPTPPSQAIDAGDGEPEWQRIVRTYGRNTPVDDLALVLFETWCKADPTSGPANHPASYIATFADMARAAISHPAGTVSVSDEDIEARMPKPDWYSDGFQIQSQPFNHNGFEARALFTEQTVRAALSLGGSKE